MYEYLLNSCLRRVSYLNLKIFNINVYSIKIFFLFRDIVGLDFLNLNQNFLFLYFCFGLHGSVVKLGNLLKLGIRYYRFCIVLDLVLNKSWLNLFFLNKYLFDKNFIVNRNILVLNFDNFELFDGLKLSPSVFFERFDGLLTIYVYFKLFFFNFLGLLK